MNIHGFDREFAKTVKSERKVTNQILQMILKSEDHRVYLKLGYSTLFKWLTQGHGYSSACAHQRIQAARLLRSVPSLSAKLEEGKMSLSNAAKAQTIFKENEKQSEEELTPDQKKKVLEKLESKTTFEADQILFKMFPETAEAPRSDTKKVINERTVRITVDLPIETFELLTRVREVTSHKIPEGNLADIIKELANQYLDKEDPLRQTPRPRKNSESENRCVKKAVPRGVHRVTIRKANGACQYVDTVTGKVCGERGRLQVDHIKMRARGGSNHEDNLRCLCRAHNLLMSEEQLGFARANAWREKHT